LPFARETVPKLALFAKPKPARQCLLAHRGTARSLSSHNPARQPSPGAALFPVAPHFFALRRAARAGVDQPRVRVFLAQAFLETFENSILGTDQVRPSKCVCTSSSRRRTRCTKTGIFAQSSTFAIACAIRDGVQANLWAILARQFVGRLAAPSQFYKR
jgi:hypothetical protein